MRPVWAVRGVWEIYKRTFNWISKSRYLGLQPTKTHREYPETALDRPWSEFRNFLLRAPCLPPPCLWPIQPGRWFATRHWKTSMVCSVFEMVVFSSIDGSCPFRDLPVQNQSGVNEQCPGLLLKETYGWARSHFCGCNTLLQSRIAILAVCDSLNVKMGWMSYSSRKTLKASIFWGVVLYAVYVCIIKPVQV